MTQNINESLLSSLRGRDSEGLMVKEFGKDILISAPCQNKQDDLSELLTDWGSCITEGTGIPNKEFSFKWEETKSKEIQTSEVTVNLV